MAVLNAARRGRVRGRWGRDSIRRVVKVVVYVASDPAFVAQPRVANGACKLLQQVFGSAHARSAVGVAVLPLDAPVEVELIVEASAPFVCLT